MLPRGWDDLKKVAPLRSAPESAVALEAALLKFFIATLERATAMLPQYKIGLGSSLLILFIIKNSYVKNLNVTWI